MAQATSPGSDQFQEDPSLSDETGGRTSLLSKLKHKTKDQRNKVMTKIRERSGKGDDSSTGETEQYDGEEESPTSDATDSHATKPEYKDEQTPAEGGVDDSGLSEDFEGLTTNEKTGGSEDTQTDPAPESKSTDETDSILPTTESVQDNLTSAKDQTKEKLFGGGDGSEQQFTSPDAPTEVTEKPAQAADKVAEAGKTWSQWAAEKVGMAKDTAAANAPTTSDGTPVHEKAHGTAVEAKDSAYGTAVGAKDSVAAQIPDQSSIPSDPAQQTYFQKATGGIYGAKDSLFSNTQPGEHDKALSQKVTESVGNLPATLKSSLGFGKGASSPTTTPVPQAGAAHQPSTDAPQSPGLVSRITGLFSAKKPTTGGSALSSEPATTETGEVTPMETSESQSS